MMKPVPGTIAYAIWAYERETSCALAEKLRLAYDDVEAKA